MYCPSGTPKNNILLLTERFKEGSNRYSYVILGGDFNINIYLTKTLIF